jgi:hypothetical protein
MKFLDYFKASHNKEVADKKRADNQGDLYQLYFNYIIFNLDDYSHEANMSCIIKGYNYFGNNLDDYGSVDLYAPYCFNHGELVLIWQPLNKKMVQIWNNHVFLDGEEVGQFKYDFSKDVNSNYSKYLGLDKDQLKKFNIQGKARYD